MLLLSRSCLGFLLLLSFIASSSTMKCYQCNPCPDDGKLKDCEPDQDRCFKSYDTENNKVITRNCAKEKNGFDKENKVGCENVDSKEGKGINCYCKDKDGCNGGMSSNPVYFNLGLGCAFVSLYLQRGF